MTPIRAESTSSSVLQKSRRSSFFHPASVDGSPAAALEDDENGDSPKTTRPRTLIRSGRPKSLFGSLRSLRSTDDDDRLTTPTSKASSVYDEDRGADPIPLGGAVLCHGEAQRTGMMFRKKRDYLVLTERHLIRFKSHSRALEAFPSLPARMGRTESPRHASTSSAGSASEMIRTPPSSATSIPLQNIVAVSRLDDGKPAFCIEVAQVDDDTSRAGFMTLQLRDPSEADTWVDGIRRAVAAARDIHAVPYPQRSLEYVARAVERERDYDPGHFQIFRVVQRGAGKTVAGASSEDLSKMTSSVCYLVVGIHKIHLIPVSRPLSRSSASSLGELESSTAYGILAVTSIDVKGNDDSLEIFVRLPPKERRAIFLASVAAVDIAVTIRHVAEYLRPQWLQQPLRVTLPIDQEDLVFSANADQEEYGCFRRTLTAYCIAFEIDASNIRYAIETEVEVEDGPRFVLLAPTSGSNPNYGLLELLAVLRSLRYNERFRSISFGGISLDPLLRRRDVHGTEHVAWNNRSGTAIGNHDMGQKNMLVQEIQAIAAKSKKLRRMDFTSCINKKPQDDDTGPRDPGCGIVEALFPLCRRQLTNVDWIVLSGIELGETDLDYFVDAAVQRCCHLRALEISRCGLMDRSLQMILNSMLYQDNTLEAIDISGNLARLSPSTFQGQIGHFAYIRRLNLSRVHRTSGPEPLVTTETILTWRLEELDLSETSVNERTVQSLAAYLSATNSETLRELRLNQCNLTGKDVATFMRSMTRVRGVAREMHMNVSENRLEKEHDDLVHAIADGCSPSHMSMRMLEYHKEDRFRELILAIKKNTTLRSLDLSKASLPYDANHDTCEALKQMFTENKTLQHLDISGEYAHLEVAKFGIGLNHALRGLETNCALRVLRIEYQKLGLQGANTLADVLRKNSCLREIYCEHNDINLQAITTLVNGLEVNKTVVYLPRLDSDREASLQSMGKDVPSSRQEPVSRLNPFQRGIAAVKNVTTGPAPARAPTYTDHDVREAIQILDDKWDSQTTRLEQYLQRNRDVAEGVPVADEDVDTERPDSGTSFTVMLERARLDTTPTVERGDALAAMVHDDDGKTLRAAAPSSPSQSLCSMTSRGLDTSPRKETSPRKQTSPRKEDSHRTERSPRRE